MKERKDRPPPNLPWLGGGIQPSYHPTTAMDGESRSLPPGRAADGATAASNRVFGRSNSKLMHGDVFQFLPLTRGRLGGGWLSNLSDKTRTRL